MTVMNITVVNAPSKGGQTNYLMGLAVKSLEEGRKVAYVTDELTFTSAFQRFVQVANNKGYTDEAAVRSLLTKADFLISTSSDKFNSLQLEKGDLVLLDLVGNESRKKYIYQKLATKGVEIVATNRSTTSKFLEVVQQDVLF